MRLHILPAVALMGMITGAAASPDVIYDDAAISREFVRTTGYFCGKGDPVGSSLKWILNTCCEGDTNRYLRIAKETAASNTNFAYMAIALVEKHGSVDDLPFLYQYTNDVRCIGAALEVILKLGGLTEESVAAASAYIKGTNITYHVFDRNHVASELLRAAAFCPGYENLKALAASNALCFARNSLCVDYNDGHFQYADPSYKCSKRRLSVLRAVLPRCQGHDNLMNYVTNAIDELVAYPEANLPE